MLLLKGITYEDKTKDQNVMIVTTDGMLVTLLKISKTLKTNAKCLHFALTYLNSIN